MSAPFFMQGTLRLAIDITVIQCAIFDTEITIPDSVGCIDADSLETLCEDFRRELFKLACKEPRTEITHNDRNKHASI